MPLLVAISFRRAGKLYYFDPGEMELAVGEYVIVETSRGTEMGKVSIAPKTIEKEELVNPVKKVIRQATDEDYACYFDNKLNAVKAFKVCNEKIKSHKLPMKLVEVEYTLDGNKVIFYFSAEGRIDFRNLVRELAAVFKKRIELHQIGVRDEAKMLGGLGPCGLPVCCSSFMKEFDPVSIKMAKEQNLSLNPERISGTCGRLMCCLKHEYQFYHEASRKMPEFGSIVESPEGEGIVVDMSIPKGSVVIELSSRVRVEVPVKNITSIMSPKEARNRANREKEERAGEERAKEEKGKGDRPRGERPGRERPGRERPGRERPGRERSKDERPKDERVIETGPEEERPEEEESEEGETNKPEG